MFARNRQWLWITTFSIFSLVILESVSQPERREWLPGKEYMQYLRETPALNPNEFYALNGANGEVNTIKINNEITLPPENPETKNTLTDNEEPFFVALELMKSGDLAAAENLLVEFLSAQPQNTEAWRQLGDCRYNLGKVDSAIEAYKSALKSNPANYLARRGEGIAMLYLGYDFYEQDNYKLAHRYFQRSLQLLHECLSENNHDQLSAYGQALAAEGVSRELYNIASKALNSDNEETAKSIIRNCLDILDVAIGATEDRLIQRGNDFDARLLLGGLLLRRARILEPFGHLAEASDNLLSALEVYQPIIKSGGAHSRTAKMQAEICSELIKSFKQRNELTKRN